MAHDKRMVADQPLLLSIADVAIVRGVCPQTVSPFICFEHVPPIKRRGVGRVHPDSLQKWFEEHEHQRI
jgi:hypothetical protein